MKYFPEVVQAITDENKIIFTYFSDGRITRFDMKPLIEKGGIFKKLEDSNFFSNRLTVMNGTPAWDLSGHHDPADCIDIDPVTLYEAEQVSDPQEKSLMG